MRGFRLGLIDICTLVVVAIAIFLPPRQSRIVDAYELTSRDDLTEERADVAALQGRLAVDPGDGDAADELSQLLVEMGQHDMALRVASAAAAEESPSRWRAELAVSSVHASRIEIQEAHDHAARALEICSAAGDDACPAHEAVRLRLYTEQLAAGVAALTSGADPRLEPDEFRAEMARVHPTARFRPARGNVDDRE